MPTPDHTPAYMSAADFSAKVQWEGGTFDALDYGLKHTDLDPDDPKSKDLRAAWADLEQVYRGQVKPLAELVDELLEAIDEAGEGTPA